MQYRHDHTISGLLKKRADLMGEAQALREKLAEVGNTIESLDVVLRSLGFEGDLDGMRPRSNRVVFFARNELRRFVMAELRAANGQPISARDLAEKIITAEGKDPRDGRLRNDIVKRAGKALKLLRQQGVAESRGKASQLVWHLNNAG